jgi:methyltransferase (TIGR00027 family)
MRGDRPSKTAEYVAAARGLGTLLPPAARLIDDPWGAIWTGSQRLRRASELAPGLLAWVSRPAWRWLLYLQVRSFALDEAVRRFAAGGGRQLVLLGAGLDARALRLRDLGLRVFEIDHPATQGRKRSLVGDAATFVALDFEKDPSSALPARLKTGGYALPEPACVLWEGVTMYLSEAAIDDTLGALRATLAPGSVLVFTYFTPAFLAHASLMTRLVRRRVARGGEPWRFGWEPSALPSWLAARGFVLESDDDIGTLAARFLPPEFASRLKGDSRRVAVAHLQGVA